jgi:hypothetical protein
MHIDLLSNDILYKIFEYLININNIRYIQKKWKDIKMNSKQFEFILMKKLFISPLRTRLMIPINRKLRSFEKINVNKNISKKEYYDLLNKLKRIKLYNTNYKLLFWKQVDYNKSSAHNIEFEIRLIYTKKKKLY